MKARVSSTIANRSYRELYELIAALEGTRETELLLKDLLTPQELDSIAERWQEIQLLAKGIPQREIADRLGISISKITRGSNALKYGSGGFAMMLRKMGKKVA